jgi:hypothetical protein
MGLIARFQRKSAPSADSRYCTELAPSELRRLKLLSGIVRLAAALDRTRQGRVLDIELEARPEDLTFVLVHEATRPPDVELHKAGLERSGLEKSFERKVRFRTRAAAGEG